MSCPPPTRPPSAPRSPAPGSTSSRWPAAPSPTKARCSRRWRARFGLPEGFGGNWDALADALGDLSDRPDPRLALLWVDADASLGADLQALLSAVLLLDRAAADLAEEHEGSRQLEIFLLGAGAGFPGPA